MTRRALYRDYATYDFRPAVGSRPNPNPQSCPNTHPYPYPYPNPNPNPNPHANANANPNQVGSPLIDACADSTPPGRAHLRRADEAATQAATEAAQGGARLGRAPDIGAYEFGDRVYWMPGRRAHLLWPWCFPCPVYLP